MPVKTLVRALARTSMRQRKARLPRDRSLSGEPRSVRRLGAQRDPEHTLLTRGADLLPRASTALSLAGYASTLQTDSTTGLLQGWRLTRGLYVPLAALSRPVLLVRAQFRLRRVQDVKPKARRGSHCFKECGRTPSRRVISTTTTKSIYQQFKFRAKARHNLSGMPPCASGHCFASGHYELSGVLRPSGDTNSLHNVLLLLRLRPHASRTLLNQFVNMVFHRFPPGGDRPGQLRGQSSVPPVPASGHRSGRGGCKLDPTGSGYLWIPTPGGITSSRQHGF